MRKNTAMTRRMLVAGAAAGSIALASAPASAQRCPPAAARTKGPAVFRDLDQIDIEEGYDNDVYAFNSKTINERRVFNNRIAQELLAKPQRLKYGPAEIERARFLQGQATERAGAGIHPRRQLAGRARRAVHDLCRAVREGGREFRRGRFHQRARDRRRHLSDGRPGAGARWPGLYRNARDFGGNPDALYLISRSSGSHLASCVLITEWEKQGLPRTIVKGAVMGSGMYDLAPVRLSKRRRS